MSGRYHTPGRVAGIDYGEARIGVAISDAERQFASPLANYSRRGGEQDAQWFRRLVEEHEITMFVVGLPLHMDGRESEKSLEARRFAAWLAETTGTPVELFDERLTSHEAEQLLIDAEMPPKKRKQKLDMLAAQIILKGYLEVMRDEG
ncbi:MAG: Holliday junction resolvase RuvX [Pirellulales bacterium]|nr:Holliday junction resolvase RuvX [Pirellulales bacterium]